MHAAGPSPVYELKRHHRSTPVTVDWRSNLGKSAHVRIRCPLCFWQPSASSLWYCHSGGGSPEPPFDSCGTAWHTFSTRGRCPGCGHQWQWTSCLRCRKDSPHEDWYEVGSEDQPAGR